MGNLPEHRLNLRRLFENVGLDYCGPFYIKEKRLRNRNKIKFYVAVFVCFVTKTVHIKVVTDLSTETCFAAIKRVFCQRGKSKNIYSDNATNFVGARNEMIKTWTLLLSPEHNNSMKCFLADEGNNWHFIPPRSPHFGGLWRAAVKSFKRHLHRTVF